MNKQDFPIFKNNKGLIYLDSAASAQKPYQVIEAMDNFMRNHYANVHRGAYYLSEMATIAFENARHTVATFLGVLDKNIIFTKGATDAINLVAGTYGRTLKAGDEILLSEAEHHSNLVPWQLLSSSTGVVLKFVKVLDSGELDMEDFKSKLSSKTRLVAVTQMSNVLGIPYPIDEIVHLSHAAGAKVLIDGCQGIVHGGINLSNLGVDFYAFSGHKLYGPTGVGILYAPHEFMDTLMPLQGGGDMVKSVHLSGSVYADSPARFEAGTPPIIESVGLGAAIDYVTSVGVDEIEKAEDQAMQLLKDGLGNVKDIDFLGDIRLKKSLVCFNLTGIHPQDIAMVLAEQNVAVRVGHHCAQPITERFGVSSSVRVSLGMYNDGDDVSAFITALMKAQKILGARK